MPQNTPGYFLNPVLVKCTTNQMTVNRDEFFGPVASINEVDDYDEALSTADDTQFGLTSGICSSSLIHAAHFKRTSRSGMVMVNTPTAGVDYHVPRWQQRIELRCANKEHMPRSSTAQPKPATSMRRMSLIDYFRFPWIRSHRT